MCRALEFSGLFEPFERRVKHSQSVARKRETAHRESMRRAVLISSRGDKTRLELFCWAAANVVRCHRSRSDALPFVLFRARSGYTFGLPRTLRGDRHANSPTKHLLPG